MRTVWIVFFLFVTLFGSGRYLSPIPLPKTYFIDLDIYPCDEYCLQEHLQNGEYLSFMAKIKKSEIENFKSDYQRLAHLLNAHSLIQAHSAFIVLLYHKKLKRYTNFATKALLAYFLQKKIHFALQAIPFTTQEELQQILQEKEPDLFILLIGYSQLSFLDDLQTSSPLYIPTINKKLAQKEGENLYFGGVNYPEQVELLASLARPPLALFYLEDSFLSKSLSMEFNTTKTSILYPVDKTAQNLKPLLKENKELNTSSVVFNTPLVKTALILSQMRLYSIEPPIKLSTQINYNPKLFHLTQPKERQGLIIATDISDLPPQLQSYALLFGNGLEFDWIGYSSCVGTDNLIEDGPLFKERFIDNQLRFQTTLKKCQAFSFEAYREVSRNSPESLQVSPLSDIQE